MKMNHGTIFFLMVFIGLVGGQPNARAVDYRDLAIEQRAKELDRPSMKPAASEVLDKEISKVFEAEKQRLNQQLTIIAGDEDTKYSIVPGDTVQIRYMDRGQEIMNVYKVNPQGEVVLPLTGAVKIAQLNRGQARGLLNERMQEYIRSPQLTIDINTAGKYIVLGAAGPGMFKLEPDLHIMEALFKAGYDEGRANMGSVLLMRGSREKPTIIKLNLKKLIKRGDRTDDIALKPDDIIYVPETLLYNVDNLKDKILGYITDYYTLGGTTILQDKTTQDNVDTTK